MKGSATYPPKSNLVVVGESTALVYETIFGIKKNPNPTVRDKDKDMVMWRTLYTPSLTNSFSLLFEDPCFSPSPSTKWPTSMESI
eukprot:gene27312-36058_t